MLDALGNDAVGAQATHLILLVGFEVALEPFHMAVTLEGEDVSGQAVKEPAVVGDDHGAARELFQSLFKVLKGFDVQVVGRFVEQDQITARGQGLGQVDAVALTAGQLADLLCWSPPLKLKLPT